MSHDSSTQPPSDNGRITSKIDNLWLSSIFNALSHPHRRHALTYLIENGGSVPVDNLYNHIVSQLEPSENGSDAYTSVKVAFRHWHRPKLEDTELIEYNDEDQVVSATETAANLKAHFELSP